MQKKIGLALGAGSTKGFAHIGILQVLEENHIPIDMIAGSSIGAIIGSIYAVGTDLNMLEKFLTSMNVRSYLDIKNPLSGGLLRGDKIEELVKIFTHNKTFVQTRIPFCCVAVDATNACLDVLEDGVLHEAVRASMSIPAIFQPVQLNGKTYIDGGVIERVPCKALRDRGMDVVIGVDVGYHGGEVDVTDMNAYTLMNHTINIMQWEMTKYRREQSDLMLVPEVLYIKGHFQMDRVADCIAEGRRTAMQALPQIIKLIQ
ncbi:MAG: patatin-like phospholipase family protein [Clostridia bacterium]